MLVSVDVREPVLSLDIKHYITLMPDVYYALMEYVRHYKTEVSGCGVVTRVVHDTGEVQFLIDEVLLPDEQDNTYASTDIDAKVIGSLLHKFVTAGGDPSKLRCHWHSHANMEVFHSETDKDNYKDLDNGDFLISLVLNKKGDVLGGLHIYKDVKMSIVGIPVYVHVPQSTHAESVVRDSIKKLDEYSKKHEYDYYKKYDRYDKGKKQIGYTPDGKNKNTHDVNIWDKDYKAKRRALLGTTYNVKFEECSGQINAWQCKACKNEIACTKYFLDGYDKEAIEDSRGRY